MICMAHKKKATSKKHDKGRRPGNRPPAKEWAQTPPRSPLPAASRSTPLAGVSKAAIEDMLPLLEGDLAGPPTASDAEDLMSGLVASDGLAQEPELQAIFFEPRTTVDTYVEVATSKGITPQAMTKMPEGKRNEAKVQIAEASIRRLMTDDLRQEILAGLDALRLRLKRSGKKTEAARAAALLFFLSADSKGEIWPSTGLVWAIFERSLAAGFELLSIAVDTATETEGKGARSLMDKLKQSPLATAAAAFLDKTPGLRGFLSKEADKMWDAGQHAVFAGDLYLELYSDEELVQAVSIIADVAGFDPSKAGSEADLRLRPLSTHGQKTLIKRLHAYVTQLFTPQRLEQLRVRLANLIDERPRHDTWLPFLIMVQQYMAEEHAVEHEQPFLINSLLGELRVLSEKAQEAASEAAGEETTA